MKRLAYVLIATAALSIALLCDPSIWMDGDAGACPDSSNPSCSNYSPPDDQCVPPVDHSGNYVPCH